MQESQRMSIETFEATEREREKEREKQDEAEEWERGSEPPPPQASVESEKEKERKKRERIASSLARIGHKGAPGTADEMGAQTFVRYAESEDETLSIGKKRDKDTAAAATTIVSSGLPDGSSDDKQPIEQLAVLQPHKESKKKREKEKEKERDSEQHLQQHNDREELATFVQKSERKESKKKKERDKDEPQPAPLQQQQQKIEDGDEDKSGGSDKDREKRREVRKNISPSEERRKRDKREEKTKAERAKEKNENGAGSDSETPTTPVPKKKPLAGSREGKAASKAAKEELREKRRSLERKTKEGLALGQVTGAPTSTALIVFSSGSAPAEAESSDGSARKVSGGASALGGGGTAQPDREDSGEFYRHLSEGVPRILDQVLTPQRVRRDKSEAATDELSSATADAEAENDTEAAVEPGASDAEPLADVAATRPASAGSGIKLTRSTLAKILFEEPDAPGASPVATDEPQREEPPLPAVEQPMEDEPWAIYLGMVGPNADDEEAEEELLHLYQQQHPFSAEELGGEMFVTMHDDLALPRSQSYSPTLTAATRPMPLGSPLRVLSPPGSAPSERASSAAHSTSPSPPPSGFSIQPSPRSQSPPPSPPRLDRPTPHRYLQPDRSITPPTASVLTSASTSAHPILSDADRTTSAPVLPPSSLGSGVSALTALPAHLHIDPSTDYRKAVARVAAQLHPDLALSKMSLVVMNKIVNLVFDRIATLVLSPS